MFLMNGLTMLKAWLNRKRGAAVLGGMHLYIVIPPQEAAGKDISSQLTGLLYS